MDALDGYELLFSCMTSGKTHLEGWDVHSTDMHLLFLNPKNAFCVNGMSISEVFANFIIHQVKILNLGGMFILNIFNIY